MVDGRMERSELRAYLRQLLHDVKVNIAKARTEGINDEDNGCTNDEVKKCLVDIEADVAAIFDKVHTDVRLKDTLTCEECREEFNRVNRFERFCSYACEEMNDAFDDEDEGLEDDCS